MNSYEQWPALPYDKFQSTAHLIHMGLQIIGKLKLHTPFEPHWANLILLLTSRGFTTGPIPYQRGTLGKKIRRIYFRLRCHAKFK